MTKLSGSDDRPKYYVYVSDTKIDMIFAQVPQKLRDRLAAELRLDLKVVSLTLKENPSDQNRYTRTRIVGEYLSGREMVGTLDEPASYFRATMTMEWMCIDSYNGETPRIVYFTGVHESVVVGLTGSYHHVVGQAPSVMQEVGPGPSYLTAGSLPVIASYLRADEPEDLEDVGNLMEIIAGYAGRSMEGDRGVGYRNVFNPLQECEFLARLLWRGSRENQIILLGSPLYVTLVD